MKRTINANKKAIRLPLWLKNEKAMGPNRSPMAHYPVMGMPLRVTLIKIKIKVFEIIDVSHGPSFWIKFKTYPVELSRGILESSEKLLFAP